MSTRFYRAPGLDARQMGKDLFNMLIAQGYQVQYLPVQGRTALQLRKGGEFEALLGMQAALSVTLQPVPGGIVALLGEQQWIDKAALGIVGMMFLWPLIFTAGAGVLRQATLEGEILQILDTAALQQRPGVQMGPVPPDLENQVYQQFYQGQPMPPNQAPPQPQQPHYTPPPQPQQPHYTPPPQPQRPEPHYTPPMATPPPMPGPRPEQRPETQAGAIPLPGHGQKQCAQCSTINEADDLYCSHCGKPLNEPAKVQHCASCEAPLKPGAAFCTRCGTPVEKVAEV